MRTFKYMVVCLMTIAFMGVLGITYVFDKLNDYKREIIRINNYQKVVLNRHEEDLNMLFNRLNRTDAHQQDYDERLEKLEWWSTHRY